MSEISSLPANLVSWLKEQAPLSYIVFLTEFPAIKKAVPLKKTTVAVGIKEMEIVDSFTENENGILEREEFCRDANITLRLSIHAPFSSGGSACHQAFTDIMDCLSFESGLNIITSGCDDIISDRDTDAFVLRAWLKVKSNLCPAEISSLPLPSFFSKDLLCGTHISDNTIHVTSAQKEFLNNPIVCGSYIGSGNDNEEISIGYKPKFVFVSRVGFPLSDYKSSANLNYVISAIAGSVGGSLGLSITDNGFRASNNDNYIDYGYRVRLNELGKTYLFFAIK